MSHLYGVDDLANGHTPTANRSYKFTGVSAASRRKYLGCPRTERMLIRRDTLVGIQRMGNSCAFKGLFSCSRQREQRQRGFIDNYS